VVQRCRQQLSFANVVAVMALFVALGGTAYAITRLPKNSVGTKQIRNRAVTLAKISPSAQKSLAGAAALAGGTGAIGQVGPPGPSGASGPTVLAQPAAWVLRGSSPQSDSITTDSAQSDTTGNATEDAFKFGGFGGPFTATGTIQEQLLSPSEIGGSPVRLSSVGFCYFVGPYPPGNTLTNTRITKVRVYQLNETDSGSGFPPVQSAILLDQSVSLANKSHGCPSYNLSSPPTIVPGSYLFVRVEAVDTQGNGDSTGALVQLGRVSATYGL
jgi:hypothetical protein